MSNVLPGATVAQRGAVHERMLDEHRPLNMEPAILTQPDGKGMVRISKSTGTTKRRYEMRTRDALPDAAVA